MSCSLVLPSFLTEKSTCISIFFVHLAVLRYTACISKTVWLHRTQKLGLVHMKHIMTNTVLSREAQGVACVV